MALHSVGARWGMVLVLLFSFAGWGISVGGLAKVTNECRERDLSAQAAASLAYGHIQPFPVQAGELDFNVESGQSPAYDCGIHFSLDWWIVAYEFFIVIYAVAATFSELLHSKHTVMALTSVSIILYIFFTSIHVKLAYDFSGGAHDDDEVGQSYKATAAGGIVVCICNFIFMFVFGTEEAYHANGEPINPPVEEEQQ